MIFFFVFEVIKTGGRIYLQYLRHQSLILTTKKKSENVIKRIIFKKKTKK